MNFHQRLKAVAQEGVQLSVKAQKLSRYLYLSRLARSKLIAVVVQWRFLSIF